MYFLPVVPAAALMSGAAIKKMLYFKKSKGLLIAPVIIAGVLQYFSILSYSRNPLKREPVIIRQIRNAYIHNFMLRRAAVPNLMTDVARIIWENRDKKLIFFQEHPAMHSGGVYWLSPIDILLKTNRANAGLDYKFVKRDTFNDLSHIGDILKQSDILFCNVPGDIKEEANLKEFVEKLMEGQIEHVFMHPYMFMNDRQAYDEIIVKKNIRYLFGGKSAEDIFSDFAANLASYELIEKKECYPENRLYVYKKRVGGNG